MLFKTPERLMVWISSLENNFTAGENSTSISMKALDLYSTLNNYIDFSEFINAVIKTEKMNSYIMK